MTALRRRMVEDLQLRGLALKTQPCYVDAVKQLAQHDRRSPDQISDEELRQYFLFLLNEKQVADSTFRLHLYGITCLYERTLQRPWPVFARVRPRKGQQLPVVLSPQEVRHLLALVHNPTAQMCLRMIDACGLRLRAAPAGRDTAASRRHRPCPYARASAKREGRQRPPGAAGPPAPRTLASVLAQPAAPCLAVPGSPAAGASACRHASEDLQSRRAPERDAQRCLHSHAAA